MYDNNNYPNTNTGSTGGDQTAQNRIENQNPGVNAPGSSYQNGGFSNGNQLNSNPYGGGGSGEYYRNVYPNNTYAQGSARSPYENRTGSYQYGNTYPNDYAQAGTQTEQRKAKPKKDKKPFKGSYLKKALVCVSLGLLFGVFAGLGVWGVQALTGMSDNSRAEAETTPAAETMSEGLTSENDAAQKTDGSGNTAANGLHVTQSVTASAVDVSEVAKEVMPAIVSINNHYAETMSWFGQQYVNEADASGSGIIVGQNDTELLIATNYHVISDTEGLTVQFVEGSEAEAAVKGSDAKMDLAVIAVKIDDIDKATLNEIAVATLGDSDSLVVGEPAIAIGNSLGYGQSVTTGVISALNRTIELSDGADGTFIQTDAAINPGNSGGALLNMKGEVIGINSNKIGGSAIEGMGYAIPISAASPIIAELMLKETKNKVAEDERGYLGITGLTVTEYVIEAYDMPEGVYISQVYEDSAAAKAGLHKGDIITSFNGERITSMDELQRELEFHATGDTVDVTVMSVGIQGYVERTVQMTLGNKIENQ